MLSITFVTFWSRHDPDTSTFAPRPRESSALRVAPPPLSRTHALSRRYVIDARVRVRVMSHACVSSPGSFQGDLLRRT